MPEHHYYVDHGLLAVEHDHQRQEPYWDNFPFKIYDFCN